MRRERALVAVAAGALLAAAGCSLLVDTGGLSGGDDDAGANGDAGGDAPSGTDAPSADSGGDGGGPSALGPIWLAYGTAGGKLGVRAWNAATTRWSTERAGPDVGGSVVRWVVPKETPRGSMLAVGTTAADGPHLTVFELAGDGTWKTGFTTPVTQASRRGFDIELESVSGDVVVVYEDGTPTLKFRTRGASGWSGAQVGPKTAGSLPAWVELARNPLRDELTIAYADTGINLFVSTFASSMWTAETVIEPYLNGIDFKCFDVAYENASGDVIVVWGRDGTLVDAGAGDLRWVTREIGANSFGATNHALDGKPVGPVTLASEPTTNRIALAYDEYNCNKGLEPCDDFITGIWNGSAWDALGSLDEATTTLYAGRPATMPVGVAWALGNDTAVAAYHRDLVSGAGALAYATYGAGAWSAVSGSNAGTLLPPRASLALFAASKTHVVAMIEDTQGALWSRGYSADSKTWLPIDDGTPLATGLVSSGGVPFGVTAP